MNLKDRFISVIRGGSFGIWFFLAILAAGTTAFQPEFLDSDNIRDILTQAAPLGIVVIGQTFVILVRGLDLSIGSLMATVAVIATAFNTSSDAMIPVIFLVCIAISAVVGLVNGWLVAWRGVSPFLATLAMMIVLQGLRFAWTKGAPSGALPDGFRYIGAGHFLGVPINIMMLLFLATVFWVLLEKSKLGRRIRIVGDNPQSARLVGINVEWVTVLCYVISSILAGIGGLFLVGFVGSIDNWVGRGYELDSIVAAVMGGVVLTGGRGGIAGALAGALTLVMIFNVVVILGLPVQVQFILKGLIIIIAATIYIRNVKG